MEQKEKLIGYLENNCEISNDIYLTRQKDNIEIKKILYDDKNGICPILKKEIPFDKTVIDHRHKLKGDIPTLQNKLGFIRDFLEFRVNSFEGKVLNFYKRLGLDRDIELPELLRNLADYYERDDDLPGMLHYKEVPKIPKLKKADYNIISRFWKYTHPASKKPPVFSSNTKMTDKWVKLLDEANQFKMDLESGKIKKINKIEFKRILKYYNVIYPRRKKLPIFPKEGIMTPELEELLKEIDNILELEKLKKENRKIDNENKKRRKEELAKKLAEH
jgi:hypothetical protein